MSARTPKPALHSKETVRESQGRRLERFRVDGGWMYRAVEWDCDNPGPVGYAVALCFVPDTKPPA